MIDADNVFLHVSEGDFFEARKTATTRVAGPLISVGQEILTYEGLVTVEPGKRFYLALDSQGHPYPIDAVIFEKTYEVAA